MYDSATSPVAVIGLIESVGAKRSYQADALTSRQSLIML